MPNIDILVDSKWVEGKPHLCTSALFLLKSANPTRARTEQIGDQSMWILAAKYLDLLLRFFLLIYFGEVSTCKIDYANCESILSSALLPPLHKLGSSSAWLLTLQLLKQFTSR